MADSTRVQGPAQWSEQLQRASGAELNPPPACFLGQLSCTISCSVPHRLMPANQCLGSIQCTPGRPSSHHVFLNCTDLERKGSPLNSVAGLKIANFPPRKQNTGFCSGEEVNIRAHPGCFRVIHECVHEN